MNHGRFIVMDFESRSEEDVSVGPHKYWEHASTEALCLAYTFGVDEEVFLWNMATEGIEESEPPYELFRRIDDGWLVEAHNAMFERRGWHRQMRRYGWPAIRKEQWRCSAARAAYHCLPRGLEDLAIVLQLKERKDPVGKELIRQLSKPRKILSAERKAHLKRVIWADENFEREPPPLRVFNEDPALIRRNWDYCKQDVRTERAASLALPEMPEREVRIWQMDQEMNDRGVAVDLPMARAAIEMARDEVADLNAELATLVPGIEKATQRAKVLAWLKHPTRLPHIQNTTKETLEALLKRHLPGDRTDVATGKLIPGESKRVLKIVQKVNRSSIAKYQAMVDVACDDGRLHDLLMYAGAHTLRWTAKNVQPHNFPRGGIKHIETAADVIKSGDREWARFLYGDVMEFLSHSLRGAIVSGRGKRFWVADFAAIEARVVFWLAQCQTALDVFIRGEDIYLDMASRIYGYVVLKAEAEKRQMGKQSILGLGFGMGFCKFLITLRKYGIKFTKEQVIEIVGLEKAREIASWLMRTDKFGGAQYVKRAGLSLEKDKIELILTKYIVDMYRSQYHEVPAFWKQQEAAAIHCVEERKPVEAGMITWELQGRRLVAHLPSGSVQTYWDPKVDMEAEEMTEADYQRELTNFTPKRCKKGDFDELVEFEEYLAKKLKRRKVLKYHGLDQKTKMWMPHGTYGGEVTENLVQHIARDLMADAMLRVEEHPTYENCLSVHDEEIAESGEDEGDEEEFHELISRCPPWAAGCPIDAEVAKIKFRYKKG